MGVTFTLLTGVAKLRRSPPWWSFWGDEKGKLRSFGSTRGVLCYMQIFACVLFVVWGMENPPFFLTICCILNFSKKPKTNTKEMDRWTNLTIIIKQKKHTPILFNTLLLFFSVAYICLFGGWKKIKHILPNWWWKMVIYNGRIRKKSLTNQIQGSVRCMCVTLSQVAPADQCQTGRKWPMPVTMATEPRKPQYLHISEGRDSRWWFQPLWNKLVKLDHFPHESGWK